MNSDVIYEVLKFLHLCPEENGGAILSKKVTLADSKRKSNELEIRVEKLEKPLVFDIDYNIADTNIYRNSNYFIVNGCQDYIPRESPKDGRYTIKIFEYDSLKKFVMPRQTNTVHSIGNLTDLSYMFKNLLRSTPYLTKKWDTSKVTNMKSMFCYCVSLKVNIGKNWNTSRVTNMSSMFNQCHRLNKNIGKNWDTSSVLDMSYMFAWCTNLSRPIGQRWDITKVKNFSMMFYECRKYRRSWNRDWVWPEIAHVRGVFYGCSE